MIGDGIGFKGERERESGASCLSSSALLPPISSSTVLSSPSFSNLAISNYTFHFHSSLSRSITPIRHAKLSSEEQLEEALFGTEDEIEEGESDDEDEETESSLDLLFRFTQSLYRKLSKKAKKASRSVLPPLIAPQLVSFAVDGVLLLASLSILKAFLEVVCTLGGTVFIAVLLLRLMWAGIYHFQSSGNGLDQGGNSYGSPQPVS